MDSSSYIILGVLLFVLLVFSGFFSAAETAYTSVSITKLESGNKRTRELIKKHYKSFGWVLATIVLSNNLVNVALSAISTYLVSDALGGGPQDTIITTAIVTPLVVIFGELGPKIIAKKHPYGYLVKIVYLINFLNYLFFPITYPLSKLALQSKVTHTENEIKNILSLAHEEGVIESNEATLAQKALDLDSKNVKAIMVPRDKIVSIDIESAIGDAKKMFIKSGHSRLLVKSHTVYKGMIILKDIIGVRNDKKVKDFIKPVTIVSKFMLATRALEKLRMEKSQLAVVRNSLDAKVTIGIITIEDIIEELVGEIYDEHDSAIQIREIAHHKYIVQGSTSMTALAKKLKHKFEDSKDVTVKQWIQSRIIRKIRKNLRYEYQDKIAFKIIKNKNKQETLIEVVYKI